MHIYIILIYCLINLHHSNFKTFAETWFFLYFDGFSADGGGGHIF